MKMDDDGRWKVDRHIPVALIVAVLGQAAVVFWWASQMDARVSHIESIQRTTPNPSDRIVRLEVKLESITERLSEIKQLLTSRPRAP